MESANLTKSAGLKDMFQSFLNNTKRKLTEEEELTFEKLKNDTIGGLSCFYARDQTINYDTFVQYMRIVASLVIITLCFLKLRKSKREICCSGRESHICYKRPGLAYPIKLIEETRHRFMNICGFCVSGWVMAKLAKGEFTFHWMEGTPPIIRPLVKLAAAFDLGLLYYPIFASLASDSIIGYCFGTLYTWTLGIVFMIQRWPCVKFASDDVVAIQIIGFLPIVVFFIILGIFFPFQAIKRLVFVKTVSTDYGKLEDTPEFLHVKGLLTFVGDDYVPFNPRKYETRFPRYVRGRVVQESNEGDPVVKNPLQKGRRRLKNKILNDLYAPSKNFRYSLTVLSAAALSWLTIFVSTTDIIKKLLVQINEAIEWSVLQRTYQKLHQKDTELQEKIGFAIFPLLEARFSHYGWFKFIRQYIGEVEFWYHAALGCFYFSVIVAAVLSCISIFLVLRSYKRDLLLMYRGIYRFIPERINQGPVSVCNQGIRFVGYQVGYAVSGLVLLSITIFSVSFAVMVFMALVFRYHQREWLTWLAQKIGPVLISLFGIKMAQKFLIRFCFLQKDSSGKLVMALDNRRAFFILQYFMVYMNAALGFISAIVTIVKSTVCGLFTIGRLDMSVFPRNFEFLDGGFSAYCSMLKMDNVQRNPVLIVYTTLCLQQIRERNLKFEKGGGAANVKNFWMRREQIANRWALFVTLAKNPGLQLYRKLPQTNVAPKSTGFKHGFKPTGYYKSLVVTNLIESPPAPSNGIAPYGSNPILVNGTLGRNQEEENGVYDRPVQLPRARLVHPIRLVASTGVVFNLEPKV